MDWAAFFDMGGYAFHVWTSWGLSTASLVLIVIINKRRNAKIKRELARQIKREQKLQSEQ